MISPSLMDPSAHVITYNPMTEDTGTKDYGVRLSTLTNRYNITKNKAPKMVS